MVASDKVFTLLQGSEENKGDVISSHKFEYFVLKISFLILNLYSSYILLLKFPFMNDAVRRQVVWFSMSLTLTLSFLLTHCFIKSAIVTSSQDGVIGRHTVPLCITKRRTKTNLKTKTTRTDRKSNCMEVQ